MVRQRTSNITSILGHETISGVAQSPTAATTRISTSTLFDGDYGHYGYPNFPPNSNVGGPFDVSTYETWSDLCPVGKIWRGGPLNQFYEGSVCAILPSTGQVYGQNTITSTMGSDTYNKMKPTKPNMDLGVALYELRELPGMLRQRFLDPKNPLASIGNYWLALKFGWEPLLRDVRNYVLTQIDAQNRLKQLLRDNGKTVRRRYILFDEDVPGTPFYEEADYYQAMKPGFVTQYYSRPTHYKRTFTQHRKCHGVAAFKYWLPDGPRDVNWTRAMMARIFGLYPSPKSVYNALPWTWLIDWGVNVSKMLENMDAGVADRLAASHFYMMYEWIMQDHLEVNAWYRRESGEEVSAVSSSFARCSNKRRSKGDPFGWNTPENSLTGMQLSILGALGASRVR